MSATATPPPSSNPSAAPSPKPQPAAHRPVPHGEPGPKWWHRVIGGVVAAAIVAGGYYGWHWLESHDQGKGEDPGGGMMAVLTNGGKPSPVQVVTIQPANIPIQLSFIGRTAASQEVEVRSRVSAFLEKRSFEEGANVRKGDLLFTLEREKFAAELDSSNAALALAQAKFEQATAELARVNRSVQQKAATEKELEDWKTQLAMAKADMDAAKARIRQANLDLSYTEIRSPLTGVVGKANRDVGSYLDTMNPNADSLLATVSQIDPLYIEFSVGERDLLKWQSIIAGDPAMAPKKVSIQLADGSTFPEEGSIDFVDTRLDSANGTVRARATLPNPKGLLRPGQFVRATLLGLERKNMLAVPQQAVIQSPAGAMVFVVKDEKAKLQPVKLGEWSKDLWIIESGIKAGDMVIPTDLQTLQMKLAMFPDGIPVAPTAATQPASAPPTASTAANESTTKEAANAR